MFKIFIYALFTVVLLSSRGSCSSFSCSSCAGEHFVCDGEDSCSLNCTTSYACDNVAITCGNNQDYGANSSNLNIFAAGRYSMNDSTIICSQNPTSKCSITCGDSACSHSYIEAINTEIVNITAPNHWALTNTTINGINAGFLTMWVSNGYGVLSNANVYCPNNGAYVVNGEEYSCIIDIYCI